MSVSTRRSLLPVLTVIIVCGVLGVVFGQRVTPGAGTSDTDVRDSLRTFSTVYDVVEQNYAEPVNPDKAIYNGAIPGMLHVLDPHSNFLDPKAYAALREEQRGRYYGIGMQIGRRDNKIFIAFAFAGSPAYRAGLRAGDLIAAVDGKPT